MRESCFRPQYIIKKTRRDITTYIQYSIILYVCVCTYVSGQTQIPNGILFSDSISANGVISSIVLWFFTFF